MADIVQQVTVTENTGPDTVAVLPSDVTVGNLLVVMTAHIGGDECGGAGTATWADTQSLTFTHRVSGQNPGGTGSNSCILTAPVTSSGPETITRTKSSSNYPVTMWVLELGGISLPAVDATNSAATNGGTSTDSGNVTSANPNLLLVGVSSDDSANNYTSVAPAGSTDNLVIPSAAFLYKFVAAGTYSATFNKTGGGNRYSAAAALISFSGNNDTQSVSDTLSLSDALATVVVNTLPNPSPSDTLALSDFALGDWFKSADSVSINDAVTYSITFSGGGGGSVSDILVGDTLFLEDSILSSRDGYTWLIDENVISLLDNVNYSAPYITAATDTLALSDTIALGKFQGYSFSDTLSLLEAAQPLQSNGDSFSFLDAISTNLAAIGPTSVPWLASDQISLQDSISFISIPLLSVRGDTLQIRDEAFVQLRSNLNSYLRRYLNDVQ